MSTGTSFRKTNHILKNCYYCSKEFVPSKIGREQKFCKRNCKREYEKKIIFLGKEEYKRMQLKKLK